MICEESGFEGLDYFGGPEVMCKVAGEKMVLPCFQYGQEGVKETYTCEMCMVNHDIKELMVSILFNSHGSRVSVLISTCL